MQVKDLKCSPTKTYNNTWGGNPTRCLSQKTMETWSHAGGFTLKVSNKNEWSKCLVPKEMVRPHSEWNLSQKHTLIYTHTHSACHHPLLNIAGFWKGNLTGHLLGVSAEVIVSTSSLPNTFVFSKGYLESAQFSVATCVEKQGHGVETSPEGKSEL